MQRERGVIFDVGHGAGSYDLDIAEVAASEGFWPDTISTDLHSVSAALARDLPTTMSKILALGMPLDEIIAAVTSRPAQVIGWHDRIGALREGRIADITVLDLGPENLELMDGFGHRPRIEAAFRARATVRAGVQWFAPRHPGVGTSIVAD